MYRCLIPFEFFTSHYVESTGIVFFSNKKNDDGKVFKEIPGNGQERHEKAQDWFTAFRQRKESHEQKAGDCYWFIRSPGKGRTGSGEEKSIKVPASRQAKALTFPEKKQEKIILVYRCPGVRSFSTVMQRSHFEKRNLKKTLSKAFQYRMTLNIYEPDQTKKPRKMQGFF